jgi:CBS-domain-containing membrane protein
MVSIARRRAFRRRWLIWRARLSLPSLLARSDERRVVSIVTAVNGGIAILMISALAWLSNLPLLFPALGPSAFLLFSKPFSNECAPRSVIVGHFVGMGAGLAVWHLTSVVLGRGALTEEGAFAVFACAALALGVTCIALVWLACAHAPACATALIFALGAADSGSAVLGTAAGVILLTAQAVLINRMFGVIVPTWSPRSSLPQD